MVMPFNVKLVTCDSITQVEKYIVIDIPIIWTEAETIKFM